MSALAGKLLTAAFLLVFTTSFHAPLPDSGKKGKINWLTPEQAYALQQKEPRKMLVDLYTDWCGWCKVMDRETYAKADIADYINQNYYPVKFNAEQRQSIRFGNRNFQFIARGKGGIHSWAMLLSNNQPSFPMTVFLDEQSKIIQPIPGYIKAGEFFKIITFFGGDHYKKEAFDAFVSGTFAQKY